MHGRRFLKSWTLRKMMHGRRFLKSWTLRKMMQKIDIALSEGPFQCIYKKRRSIKSDSGRCDMPMIRDEFEHLRWLLPHIKHPATICNVGEGIRPHSSSTRQSDISYDLLEKGSAAD